jgi:hypothetical protein
MTNMLKALFLIYDPEVKCGFSSSPSGVLDEITEFSALF